MKLLKESLDVLWVELHRFWSMLVMMAISILLKYIIITSLKWLRLTMATICLQLVSKLAANKMYVCEERQENLTRQKVWMMPV